MAEIESDAVLVKRAKRDPEAFGILYERYIDKIYSYIYFHTGSEQDAEDLTARTFHQALANIRRYSERGLPFSAWLYRIAHNLVANWHRDHSRRRQVPLENVVKIITRSRQSPDELAEKQSELDALRTVIQSLPTERQLLLVLKYGESQSNADIGKTLRRSEGAVKSLLHRTLLDLRKALQQRGFE